MKPIEHRYESLTWEIRADDDAADRIGVLRGHAAVFNSLSHDLGGFREKIDPGAFEDSLTGDVRALWNHSSDHLLGRTSSGTLRLSEDRRGLKMEVDVPDTAVGRDLLILTQRGDVTGMSFGFRTVADRWESRKDGAEVRTLEKVELVDVSPVTFPAYPRADDLKAAQRSLESWKHVRNFPRLTMVRSRLIV